MHVRVLLVDVEFSSFPYPSFLKGEKRKLCTSKVSGREWSATFAYWSLCVCTKLCTHWCLSSVLVLGCYPLMLSNAGIFVYSRYHLPLHCFFPSTRVFLRCTEFIDYFLVPPKGICQSHLISHALLVKPGSAVSGPFLSKHTMSHSSYSLLFMVVQGTLSYTPSTSPEEHGVHNLSNTQIYLGVLILLSSTGSPSGHRMFSAFEKPTYLMLWLKHHTWHPIDLSSDYQTQSF